MTIEQVPPSSLSELQHWFAKIITRPLTQEGVMQEIAPSGDPMDKEASLFIVPSPTLSPHLRIQIYNQQYWWRLLNVLQEDYPFLLRLFGYADFNQTLAVPYLLEKPPKHWSLSQLSLDFFDWLKKNYEAADKNLVLGAAEIDHAYLESFFSKNLPKMGAKEEVTLESLEIPVQLQPHLKVFSFHLPLFELREIFLKEEPPFWEDNDFPTLNNPKPTHYVLWKNQASWISYEEIDETEALVLKRFQKAASISAVCTWLEHQPKELLEKAESNLHLWFQKWSTRGWLAKD